MTVGRTLLRSLLAAALLAAGLQAAAADEWRTTSSLIGESKYGDNFQHYDYVNPDAPKGGTLNSVVARHIRQLQSLHRAAARRPPASSPSAAACSTTR